MYKNYKLNNKTTNMSSRDSRMNMAIISKNGKITNFFFVKLIGIQLFLSNSN